MTFCDGARGRIFKHFVGPATANDLLFTSQQTSQRFYSSQPLNVFTIWLLNLEQSDSGFTFKERKTRKVERRSEKRKDYKSRRNDPARKKPACRRCLPRLTMPSFLLCRAIQTRTSRTFGLLEISWDQEEWSTSFTTF